MPDPLGPPLGYAALIQRYDLKVMPLWHASALGRSKERETVDGRTTERYPAVYDPGPDVGDQLEFALKYDGVRPDILRAVFQRLGASDVTRIIAAKPTGKYRRRLWFWYEFLTGERLDLPDAPSGTHIPLLDPDDYLVTAPRRSSRHRVDVNLLGDEHFCPLIRCTPELKRFMAMRLDEETRRIVTGVDPLILRRAIDYLYTKETMSSYAIERETPNSSRAERFVSVLRDMGKAPLSKAQLIILQNAIVDPRFVDRDWRTNQNYIGSVNLGFGAGRDVIHYVCPRPQDVAPLMTGVLTCINRASSDNLFDPVAAAAAAAFGFVLIHPFEDGNGRLHRALIHHILARRAFTPPEVIVPLSASILADPTGYDACLETFSQPLLSLVDYDVSPDGIMTVSNETHDFYRFPDLTAMAEFLYCCCETSIRHDLAQELAYLTSFDQARLAIREVVDLPDRLLALFIRLVMQNGGRLSESKRAAHFAMLRPEEIAEMERLIAVAQSEAAKPATPSP